MTAKWPTALSEAGEYVGHKTARMLTLGWCSAFALGCLIITNPYSVAFTQMEATAVAHYRFQLSLVATCFYMVPLLAIAIVHNLPDRVDALLKRWQSEKLPPYARSELERVTLMGRMLVLAFILALCFIISCIIGLPILIGNNAKVIGIIFTYMAALMYGLIFIILGGGISKLTRTAGATMLVLMIVVTLLYVGTPITSDILLLRQFGTMPAPSSPDWFNYLQQTANSPGILIYAISPPELFMLFGTMTFAQGNTMPLWQGMMAMAAFMGAAWFFSAIAGGLSRKQEQAS